MASDTFVLAGTTPTTNALAVTKVVGRARNVSGYDHLTIVASVVGATGGTLDFYLQVSGDGRRWIDYLHLPQLAAGAQASTTVYAANRQAQLTPVAVGIDLAPALAAGAFLGTDWGNHIRLVAVAGAGTAAGAAFEILLMLSRTS